MVTVSELSERLREAAGGKTFDDIVELTHKAGRPLGKGTVHRLLTGKHGDVKQGTLLAIAAALGLDERELRVLAGKPAGGLGPYVPTDEAASLTEYQRDAMDELIRAIVRGERGGPAATTGGGGGSDSGQDDAQKSPGAVEDLDDVEPGEINGKSSPRRRRGFA